MSARVQIGRVRMKNGGADVRVLRAGPLPPVTQHMTKWVRSIVCDYPNNPPDAYAAVALWFDAANPAYPGCETMVYSKCAALPPAIVVRIAGPTLADEYRARCAASLALSMLGYDDGDWTPDDVA